VHIDIMAMCCQSKHLFDFCRFSCVK